jgi:hypothetical protein
MWYKFALGSSNYRGSTDPWSLKGSRCRLKGGGSRNWKRQTLNNHQLQSLDPLDIFLDTPDFPEYPTNVWSLRALWGETKST